MAYTLVRNGTLIDGSGAEPQPDSSVLVENNRIHSVGHAGSISLPAGDIVEIDANGGTILPGFIDTHVHLMLEGVNIARDMQAPFSLRFFNAVRHMQRTIEAGVTSVRDAGGADAGIKRAVDSGVVVGPRMQICCCRTHHHWGTW